MAPPLKAQAIRKWVDAALKYEGDDCLYWPFRVRLNNRGVPFGEIKLDGKTTRVTRAVCILSHGYPDDPKLHAAHTCGKGHLVCVNPKHLYWATASENQMDRIKHGTSNRGEANHKAKLTADDARIIRKLKGVLTLKDLSSEFGVSKNVLSQIQNKKIWSHVPDSAFWGYFD